MRASKGSNSLNSKDRVIVGLLFEPAIPRPALATTGSTSLQPWHRRRSVKRRGQPYPV
jgi:hypothetical protein